jgi:hypothetical protein
VVAGVIAVLFGSAAIVRSDLAYALIASPSGLAFLGVAVWARRSAPARIAANRKRREAMIGAPQLWTDGELWTLRTSDDVDELHRLAERATDRRTEQAERWLVSHFFTQGAPTTPPPLLRGTCNRRRPAWPRPDAACCLGGGPRHRPPH